MRHHNCVTTGLALRLWQVALSRFLSFAALLCLSLSFTAIPALGQSNPVPFVNQPLVPSAVAPGGPDFTLTVNGTGFVSGATVNWNGTPLATTFVSSSQLTATVPAANTALNGTASITVLNPGQTTASNVIFLQVTPPSHSASFVQQGNSQGIIPGPLEIADFNGDGRLDVAGVLFFEGNSYVSALLGNGDGTFQSPVLYEVCSIAKSIAAADVNGDGKLDLVLAKSGCATGPGGTLSILLGKGNGTFQPAVDYAQGPAATALFAADLNGDGKLDLAITNSLAEG